MPVSPETNVRASRRWSVITIQVPFGIQVNLTSQAHGTKQTSTLRPAFGLRLYHFHAPGCGAAAWTSDVQLAVFVNAGAGNLYA